jgi:N-acetylmuramoyl-L-alanine amidase
VKHFSSSLLVVASLLLFPASAIAATLETWRFDSNQNQLEFTTDQDVQPTAQLLSDPTRLVIDLPGIVLGRPALTQPVGGNIRSLRIAQFDRGITRIVLEVAPGYTIDPAQVRFRGITARQWTVQIPTPQPLPNGVAQTPTPETSTPETSIPGTSTPETPGAKAATQIEAVQVTQDGLFIRTSGRSPQVTQERSADRQQITFELQNTGLAANLRRDQLINRFGVNRIQIVQSSPTIARIILNVNRTSPDWQASVSNFGGVAIIPIGGGVATNPSPTTPTSDLATIESVQFEGGNQLVIRGNRSLRYTTGWDRATLAYRITINGAQLAPRVTGPQLEAGSPVRQVRLRQEDSSTVVILVDPASGVQINEPTQPNSQTLALQLQRPRPVAIVPPTEPATPINPRIPVPLPPRPTSPPVTSPRVPNGRMVVVIDPGHGGPDPGAIGIGGLQEKGVVLDISRQVAELLEQQGVQAVLTRSDDRDLDLEPRVQLAAQLNARVFVSIHANAISLSRPEINGLETYYYESGLELARTIHSAVLADLGIPDRRVRQARFYVLRKTKMPAVLVETGFVTGRDDAARLANPEFRRRMAAAIARGILQYIQRG